MFAKKNIRKQYLFYLRNFLSAAKLLLLLQQVGTEGGGKVAGSRRERILILCKTYPSPSGKHSETSCVAGMTEEGSLIRLFPVPFRAIRDEQKFKKWQWISAQIYKEIGRAQV